MSRCAVLLRAVNVGGHNRIAMPAFRDVLEGLGCTDVQTYVQSGNAVVTSDRDPAALERAVAAALRDELDLPVAVLVRTAQELEATVAGCPFDVSDPTRVHVVFLTEPVDAAVVDGADVAPDQVVVGDRLLYVRYAGDSQGSRAAKLLASAPLRHIGTARNWRTVLALRELAG